MYDHLKFLVIVGALLLNCSDDTSMEPNLEDFSYPMEVGHKWEYTVTEKLTNFRAVSPGAGERADTSSTFTTTVEIVRVEMLGDSVQTHVFRVSEREASYEAFYTNENDGMFIHLVSGPYVGTALPKETSTQTSFWFQPPWQGNPLMAEHGQLRSPPAPVLQYPLQLGKKWAFAVDVVPTGIRKIEKEVIGTENVQVPAGEFDCFKLEWLFVENDVQDLNVMRFDYISEQGLVKRTFRLKDALLFMGNQAWQVDVWMTSELTQIQLQ